MTENKKFEEAKILYKTANADQRYVLECLFPKLKKTEDEQNKTMVVSKSEGLFKETGGVCDKNVLPLSSMTNIEEKQGEQKSIDKVEPKFKVGDWIINKFHDICLITDIDLENTYYICESNRFGNTDGDIDLTDKAFHLWSIQDAKDGDVLAYETDEEDLWIMIYWSLYEPYEGHVHYHALLINDDFSDKGTCCIYINDLKPATKEQRDFLFAKMKDAGYEWDVEKKELRKIDYNSK